MDEKYLNALAWIHATSPDPSLLNGKRAVELATRLCERTQFQSPRALTQQPGCRTLPPERCSL